MTILRDGTVRASTKSQMSIELLLFLGSWCLSKLLQFTNRSCNGDVDAYCQIGIADTNRDKNCEQDIW